MVSEEKKSKRLCTGQFYLYIILEITQFIEMINRHTVSRRVGRGARRKQVWFYRET